MRKNLVNTVIAIIAVTVAISSMVYMMLDIVFKSEHKGDFISDKEYKHEFQYDKRAI